ncbi:transposase [Type-D symbiont of Plautia stali]|uniref:transposase n=1 Tax=Type-D symbiont of Plautia stali TaxID=1560356 RepID=UPI00073F972A|nr:transposase [Type-D symbiont of Plautia stali]
MHFRKYPRLKNFEYNSAGAYFVTIICKNRNPLFGEIESNQLIPTALGIKVITEWESLPVKYNFILLDAFILMPNHLHGIIWLLPGSQRTVSNIINFFKAGVTRETGMKIWQRGFYDRVIRNESELYAIRKYILENPLKWELDRLYRSSAHKSAPYI